MTIVVGEVRHRHLAILPTTEAPLSLDIGGCTQTRSDLLTQRTCSRGRSGSPPPRSSYDYSAAPAAAAAPAGSFVDTNGAPPAGPPRSGTRDYAPLPRNNGEIYRRS
jgi:hypothetical protein